MKNKENLIVLFIIKTYILYTTQYTSHLNLNFFLFLSSYRNMIINQSVHVFSLSYFLIRNKTHLLCFHRHKQTEQSLSDCTNTSLKADA